MVLKQYVVDAFTDRVFCGNPAAVCVLETWLPDSTMLDIARENNLSETAFTIKKDNGCGYELRWFTPGGEIDLCGHATLACAYLLLNDYEKGKQRIVFSTQSGDLTVCRRNDLYEMDFPAYDLKPVAVIQEMISAIGAKPIEAFMGRDLLCVFDSASTVTSLNPDMESLKQLDGLLLQATALGNDKNFDCVSRSFCSKIECCGRPGMRFRPLSYYPILEQKADEKRADGLSGLSQNGNIILPDEWQPCDPCRESRTLLSG